jgi:Ca-activated chloride channel family protein
MKKIIALVLSLLVLLALAGCGGSGAVDEPSYELANTAGNSGDSSFDYYVPQSNTTESSNAQPVSPPQSSAPEPIGSASFDQPSYTWRDEEDAPRGVNGYVDTFRDHLSTFGIDVDTASYTRARNHIEAGRLPAPETVRVEEFVNFFEAGYPTPRDVAFGIYADGAPSPFDRDGVQLIRFGIQGYEVPEELRKPVHLTFVIDISGSMEAPDKLELVKDSMALLVEMLDEEDSVSIVVYGSRAEVVLRPTSGDQKRTILREIRRLRTKGSTNAEAGLRLGYNLAFEAFNEEGVNRVILASDGVANVGQTEASQLLRFIRRYADTGITLTTMGFGMGTFNDPFMEELADSGDGSYAYIDTMKEAERLFVDELTSTLQVIARDARIQVDFNLEAVESYRLFGYENRDIADEDFRNNEVDAGEIGAGHSVTALYAVQLVPGEEGRIATVQLRWQNPESGEEVEINGNFNTWDLERDFSETDPHFRLTVMAAYFAEILRESAYARHVSCAELLDHAYKLSREIWEEEDVSEFIWLVEETEYLLGW